MTKSLDISKLTVAYARRVVIDRLDLTGLRAGEVTALIGPNATGKTTLLRAIARLHKARGSVLYGDVELMDITPTEHARHVTYMPQSLPQRVSLTVFEAVLSALHASPVEGLGRGDLRAHADSVLDRLGISHLAMRALDELSGGQRQMASLAQAIVRNPKILLLDEPTSALDMKAQLRVMRVLRDLTRERGMTSIIVLHDIGLASRWSDRVVVLRDGRVVVEGRPEDAITPAMIADVYGVVARVERCSQGYIQVIPDDSMETERMASPAI